MGVYELQEVWDTICELVKDNDSELLGDRGGQPRKKCFGVNASTFKPKPTKVGTSDVSRLARPVSNGKPMGQVI